MAVCHCGLEDQRYWPSVLRLRTVERLHFLQPFYLILDNQKANRDRRTNSCYSPSNANIVESTLCKMRRLVTLPLLRGTIQILAPLPINLKWWRWQMCSTIRIYLTFTNIKLNLSIFKPFNRTDHQITLAPYPTVSYFNLYMSTLKRLGTLCHGNEHILP
jgi:hypothetical protein